MPDEDHRYNWEDKICPMLFAHTEKNCAGPRCMAWHSTDKEDPNPGYCEFIGDKK